MIRIILFDVLTFNEVFKISHRPFNRLISLAYQPTPPTLHAHVGNTMNYNTAHAHIARAII